MLGDGPEGRRAQEFFAGTPQTDAHTRPPGFATRANSRAASGMSGKNMKPNRAVTASNEASAKGRAPASHCRASRLWIPWRAAFSFATSSIFPERSVITTLPAGHRLAALIAGSPVPEAMSSTEESARRPAPSRIAVPTGASHLHDQRIPLLPPRGELVPGRLLLVANLLEWGGHDRRP